MNIKKENECSLDIVAFGEIMLRLDPQDFRISSARSFNVCEGGGEYNVARALKKCFRKRASVVTALVDNPVGRLVEDLVMQGGVDVDNIKWFDFDGIGKEARNGLNFVERGYGIRGAVSCSDRANTAISKLKKGDIDWDKIFSRGVRWFHTGGICAALSENMPEIIIDAMKCAKKYGTIVSYDLNYRASLWKNFGGNAKAIEVNSELVKYVDLLIGNEEDFTACLGFKASEDTNFVQFNIGDYKKMISNVVAKYPNIQAIATTLRKVKTASINDWTGILYSEGKFYEGKKFENLEVLDRVGSGDSFMSGIVYGFLENLEKETILNYGIVNGAFAMTTPGDVVMSTLKELKNIIAGNSARVQR